MPGPLGGWPRPIPWTQRSWLTSPRPSVLLGVPEGTPRLRSSARWWPADNTWLDPDHPDSHRVLTAFQNSYAAEEEIPRWRAAKLITEHLTGPITSDLEHYLQESIKHDPVPEEFRSHHWSTPIHIMAKLDMASLNMEHNLATLDHHAYTASILEISEVANDLAQTQQSNTAYPYIQTLIHHDPDTAVALNEYVRQNAYTSDKPWFHTDQPTLDSIWEALKGAEQEYPTQATNMAMQVTSAVTSTMWYEALENEHSDPTWSPHSDKSSLLIRIRDTSLELDESLFQQEQETFNTTMKKVAALSSELDRNLGIASLRHP